MASAEYAIEIAASMPAGEQTAAELDALITGLTGAGKGADFFQQAIKQVSASLDAAKAASASANGALAEGNAHYTQLEKAANKAAKAVEKLQLDGELEHYPEVAAAAAQANAALEQHAQKLKVLEANATGAAKAESAFATQLTNVKKLSAHVDKGFAQNAEKLGKIQGALGAVGGPLGAIGQKLLAPVKGFEELSGAMGGANAAALLGAAGLGIVAAAIVAVTVALAAGTLAVAAWAVGLADGARAAGLTREAAEALDPSLAALRGDMAELQKDTGLSEDALRKLAQGLKAAGQDSAGMSASLRTAALAQAALGSEASATYTKLVADSAAASKAVDDAAKKSGGAVSKELNQKLYDAQAALYDFSTAANTQLGGIVAKQMRGLGAQSETLKKRIGETFGGLNIEPVLAGLERLVGLFDQNTAAGQTIKFLFESVFQPLIDQADKAALVVEAFALGFLIGLTKIYIAVKPAIKAAKEFFGFEDSSLTDTLDLAKQAGELIAPVFIGIVGIFGLLAVAVGVAIAPFIAISAAMYALIGAVVALGVALLGGFMSAWTAVTEYLDGIDLTQMGTDLIMGLVKGITGAAGAVVGAVTGAVGGAIDSAKKLLGIASPSKVFAEIGGYTGEGFAQGVDDSAPQAQASMAEMVDPAPAAAGAGKGGSSTGASGGAMIHIENLYLAGDKASEAETLSLAEALTRLLEGDVAELGGSAAPA